MGVIDTMYIKIKACSLNNGFEFRDSLIKVPPKYIIEELSKKEYYFAVSGLYKYMTDYIFALSGQKLEPNDDFNLMYHGKRIENKTVIDVIESPNSDCIEFYLTLNYKQRNAAVVGGESAEDLGAVPFVDPTGKVTVDPTTGIGKINSSLSLFKAKPSPSSSADNEKSMDTSCN